MQAVQSQFEQRHATVLGLVVDSPQDNAALAERLGVKFPILSDPDLSTVRAYGVEHVGKDISLPATIVVGKDGRVLWAYVGDRPVDRPVLPDVLAALDAAG